MRTRTNEFCQALPTCSGVRIRIYYDSYDLCHHLVAFECFTYFSRISSVHHDFDPYDRGDPGAPNYPALVRETTISNGNSLEVA